MSEWFKVPVLKTGIPNRYRGFESSLIRAPSSKIQRVISSIGRASRLQRAGQWFDPTITQLFEILEKLHDADMVELVDTLGLGPRGNSLAGSSPAIRKSLI